VFGDLGSFFSFDRIEDMVELELQCPRKYEYQVSGIFFLSFKDFERLFGGKQKALFGYHLKSILLE
jgi:hypothetical protein